MALVDKLREEQNVQQPNQYEELMKETNELNKMMKSYINVQMDRDTVKKVTLDHELTKITKTSQEIQEKMISILKKLESIQTDYANRLAHHMDIGKNEMSENNQKTLTKMTEIEEILKTSMSEMEKTMQKNLQEVESKTLNLVVETRKGILVNYWLDVVKYGLGTAFFVVPVYLLIKFALGFLGIQL